MFRLLSLVFIAMFLLSCSLYFGATNKVSRREAANNIDNFQLPMKVLPDRALVVIVNPYRVDVTAREKPVAVALKETGAIAVDFDELWPIDDFTCRYASPGDHNVLARWMPDAGSESLIAESFVFEAGKVYYIAVETVSFKGESIDIYALTAEEGLYYIKEAVERLDTDEPIMIDNEDSQRANDLMVNSPREILSKKLKCDLVMW